MADAAGTLPTGSTGSPSDFLRNVVGQKVVVRLNSGVDYRGMFIDIMMFAYCHANAVMPAVTLGIAPRSCIMACIYAGILSCLDGYMNAALENTEEVVNGKVTNNYGDAFVRGNNSECKERFMP